MNLILEKLLATSTSMDRLGVSSFQVKFLENMYKELLEFDGIPYSTHVTRFAKRLKHAFPGIEKRTVQTKAMIYFSSDVDKLIKKNLHHHLSQNH